MSGIRSWQESWTFLESQGGELPARWPGQPGQLSRPEVGLSHDGLRLRDRRFEEVDFEGLCLPRTLIENCKFHCVSFRDTDLRLSCLFGCTFVDCDFQNAVLICAHLSQSVFSACRFTNAQMVGAELRGATLEHCDFTGANLTGARLDRALKDALALCETQRRVMVDWRGAGDVGPD